MDYQETLNSHKAELLRLKSERAPIDLDDVFSPIDWQPTPANKAFFAFVKSERLASPKEVEAARKRDLARQVLGKCPATCCEFVGAYVKAHKVTVNFAGSVRAHDPRSGRANNRTIVELTRDMRVMSTELGLPIKREAINDAVDAWYQDAREARVDVIRRELDGNAEFDWLELASRCFDCSELSSAFVAAVLQKFMHQVKTKMEGREVGHHLMPVFLGPQGSGKTTFIHKMISPLAELSRDADFKMIADERHISLWKSYVLFIDEMGHADKADMEIVKHVVTAHMLDRRPMRTTDVVSIRQCATFIGASNKTIAELIRDDTGMRRFVGLPYRSDADRDYINHVDWLAAWRSISIDNPDPMDAFRHELAAQQSASRYVSPVEAWLTDLKPASCKTGSKERGQIEQVDLYSDYLSHFHRRNDGQRPKTLNGCMQEVGRLIKAQPDAYEIEKKKLKSGNVWCWRPNDTPVHPQFAILLKEPAK
jgi:hypothetical protein